MGQPGKKNKHKVEYLEFGSLRTPRDEGSFLGVRTGRGAESSFLDGGQIEQGRFRTREQAEVRGKLRTWR